MLDFKKVYSKLKFVITRSGTCDIATILNKLPKLVFSINKDNTENTSSYGSYQGYMLKKIKIII